MGRREAQGGVQVRRRGPVVERGAWHGDAHRRRRGPAARAARRPRRGRRRLAPRGDRRRPRRQRSRFARRELGGRPRCQRAGRCRPLGRLAGGRDARRPGREKRRRRAGACRDPGRPGRALARYGRSAPAPAPKCLFEPCERRRRRASNLPSRRIEQGGRARARDRPAEEAGLADEGRRAGRPRPATEEERQRPTSAPPSAIGSWRTSGPTPRISKMPWGGALGRRGRRFLAPRGHA